MSLLTAVLPISGLVIPKRVQPRYANNVFFLVVCFVVCFKSTLFPRPDRSVRLGNNLMRFAIILQRANMACHVQRAYNYT